MRTKGLDDSPAASHLIERQMLLSRVREQASPRGNAAEPDHSCRFITVTREIGSHGNLVAEELARHLQWQVFDKQIVNFIAEDSHVRQDLVRQLDERSQSLIHDMVERLLLMAEGISFGNEEYHKALLKALAYLAARGKAVIVGRGGAFALQGEPGLHLRIVAAPETRVQRLAQRWDVSADEARRRMHQIDTERKSFIQHHFRHSLDELGFYDAIFSTDRLTIEEIVHAVLAMMTAPKQAHLDLPLPDHAPGPGATPASFTDRTSGL